MKSLKLSVFSLIALFYIFNSQPVLAQGVNDFVINSFDTKFELTNDDPQGLLKTTELIKLDFSGQNRGILRAIPALYEGVKTNPKVLSVKRDEKIEPYITYIENDNLIVRIGDPSTYITGNHEYELIYQVENVIRFYEDYDELFWDVNGDQWQQVFESVSAFVSSPASRTKDVPKCFTGKYGSTNSDCEIATETNSFSAVTSKPLSSGETMSIVAGFEKGYFTPQPWWEQYRNQLLSLPVIAFQIWVMRGAYKKWQKYGKDYKRRGIIVPYFERPKNISVMQASYVLENGLSAKHLSANVIDLAIRSYIKITEKKHRFSTKHELTLLKSVDNNLTADEQILLGGLFFSQTKGEVIELEDMKNKLYKIMEAIKNNLDKSTSEKGFYEITPKLSIKKMGAQFGWAFLSVIIGFVFISLSSGLTAIFGVISFIAVSVFSGLMTKRSISGNMLVEHMEGLKLYLIQAEKDRIKNQDAVAAPLSPKSGSPIRDVKFFEKLLPFAVALGVEKTWAKAFADIYTQQPEWYAGNWKTFNSVALASSLSSASSAAGSAFSAPSSSGSSGFSGGGGAGGGGGGGGGGGW